MTHKEITNRQSEISVELSTLDLINSKKDWKLFKQLCIEQTNLQRELDKIDGKTYNSEKWITHYSGSSYTSLKDARFDLINKIKDLPGVVVSDDKTGVASVTVYTEFKIYYYCIHAHYMMEKVPGSEHIVKDMFGGSHEECDYRPVYGAYIHKESNWTWRY